MPFFQFGGFLCHYLYHFFLFFLLSPAWNSSYRYAIHFLCVPHSPCILTCIFSLFYSLQCSYLLLTCIPDHAVSNLLLNLSIVFLIFKLLFFYFHYTCATYFIFWHNSPSLYLLNLFLYFLLITSL